MDRGELSTSDECMSKISDKQTLANWEGFGASLMNIGGE